MKININMMPDFAKQRTVSFFYFYCLILLFVVIVEAEVNKDHEDASFYGESYIVTPVEDANSSTSILLDFRTRLPNGLLFLAAGDTDYVLVQLNNGVVETRVNLGSGEAVVFSARGVRLDDTRWHQVVVNRTLDSVYVTIDGIGQGQGSTPGAYHNLNVDLGVFLGGVGNLKKDVYRNTKSFRGCLRDVSYNGISVLHEARDQNSAQNTFQVTWHCDEEFFASSSDISFSSGTSYVAFPYLRIYPSSSSVLSCEFKTRSDNAVLLFNSGKGKAWEDFLAVELVDGRTKLSVDKGSGVIEVYLAQPVNDGKWHKLEVSLSDTETQLKVDGLSNRTRFNLGGQNVLNLANHMYIGGLGYNARPLAIKLGLTSVQGDGAMKGSILGCVRNVHMNSRSYGFQQIGMSRLVNPECGWDFPCADDPCLSLATCVELEGPEFRCDCDQKVCVKDKFKSSSLERNKVIAGIFSIQKLEVVANSEKVIDESNIKLGSNILDAVEREENVMFRIMEQPKLGTIVKERSRANSFTLNDLRMSRIVYRQDGDFSDFDSTVLQVTFSGINQDVESKLKDKYEFVLPIHIVKKPLNSNAIQIVLGYGNILMITSGARVQITKSILDVDVSPVVDPLRLVFKIQFLRSARSRFEHIRETGKSVLTFTYRDVLDGSIWFVNGGDQIVYTTVSLSDGVVTSGVVDLRFKLDQLEIRTVNNTGLFPDYGSSCMISSYNLSSVSNMRLEKIELVYHITRPANNGAIQRKDSNSNQWMDVDSFTQDDVDANLIRYIHIPAENVAVYDELSLEVMAKGVKTSPISVRIQFRPVTLYVDHMLDLHLHKILFARMSSIFLSVSTNAASLDYSKIVFTVHRIPRKGFLYYLRTNDVDLSVLQRSKPLAQGDTFTQNDVNNGYIYYRVERPMDEEITDYVELHASYFGFHIVVRNRIVYLPTKLVFEIFNEGMDGVDEGGFKVITEDMLGVDMEYSFSIIQRPLHGTLNIINPLTSETERLNTSHFSMIEILDRQVMYLHDDSEHDTDSFTFCVIPIIKSDFDRETEEMREISGTFHIKINMRNDNAPVRTVNKIFHVITGKSKHLTIEDLAFDDPDINYDSSDLLYITQSIPNGELIKASTGDRVHNFTQRDLEKSHILLQHRGDSYGRAPLLVTDGKYFSNSLIEIQASSPYVKIDGNSAVQVRSGLSVVISPDNLILDSNLDIDPAGALFDVLDGPRFGYLRVRGRQDRRFSYQDVKSGQVIYVNNEESEEDFIKIRVSFNSVRNESNIYIKILLDGINDPPEILHNQILEVMAYGTETVTENYLHVGHKDYADDEIEFIITKLPERGFLTVKGKREKLGSAPEFTQQDIKDGMLTYTSQSPEIAFDSIVFDVSTEHQALRNMEFLISIIPQKSQVSRANLTVSEGGSVTLSLNHLSINKQHIYKKSINVILDKLPSHGQIVVQEGTRQNPVRLFTMSSLSQGLVSYRHDNSETTSDQFSLRAVESPSQSSASSSSNDILFHQETFIDVKVTPVNDQPPKVVVNTGLQVWTGSLTLLTEANLKATDADSPPEVVTLRVVSGPSNGHLAFLNNTFRSISSFSQADVDKRQIVYVHKGSETGEFRFQATDGVNRDQVRTFRIQAKQVRLHLAANSPIPAFPNTLQPVTNASLMTTASNHNYSHPIIYTVLSPAPRKGRLVTLVSGRPSEIRTFSQEDINNMKIFYQHTQQMRSWDEADTIRIEISSTYATSLANQRIPVKISFSNLNTDNYRKLLGIKTPSAQEGNQVTITRDYFDSSQLIERIHSFRPYVKVEFSFATPVSHGSLWFKEMDAVMGDVFTQQEINNGDLIYNHDHTETTQDLFQFSVKILIPRQTADREHQPTVFNFTVDIEQVNDQRFELLNRFSKIEVTQGLEVKVTPYNLTTVDLDTGPEEIEYIILKQADNGVFVKTSLSTTAGISSFTQKDIDDGVIVFKHDGSPHGDNSVRFKVWDGKFHPIFSIMQILVIPITIQAARDRAVSIVQGQRSVFLSSGELKVSTNGDFDKLQYTITQPPQFGKLMKRHSQVTEFSQTDVEDEMMIYTMNADSPGDDFFVCNIHLSYVERSLDAVQFDVVVKPLVKQGPLLSASGSHVAITRASLDASELAQITGDNPRFDVTTPPEFGNIMMKMNRKRRNVDDQSKFSPVSSFTFQDILYTKIYYVASPSSETEDRFSYTLSAEGVPPAKGELVIQLEPTEGVVGGGTGGSNGSGGGGGRKDIEKKFTDSVPAVTTIASTSSPENGDDEKDGDDEEEVVKGAAVGPEGDDDKTAIIVGVVVTSIIIVIIIIILVVVFIRWKRRRQLQSDSQQDKFAKPRPYISGPLQLEQPHVFIEPHSDNDDSPIREEDTALMTPCSKNDDMYVNTSHINNSHNIGDTSQWIRDQNTAVTKTSPVFKQHIGGGGDDEEEDGDEIISGGGGGGGRGSNTSGDLIEWSLVDPDLLQHCYSSQPVLRNNQYWL